MSKIIGINTEFESLNYSNFDEYGFRDNISLLDYDIAIINTQEIAEDYKSNSKYQGLRRISDDDSFAICEDFKRLENQINALLEAGKNIYILIGNNPNCVVFSGEKQYSGTGKNARTTLIVSQFDTYSFLPIEVKLNHIDGKKIEIKSQSPYKLFFDNNQNYLHYLAYFEDPVGQCLAKIKSTNKAISCVVEHKSGKIIFLPMPYWKDENTEVKYWNKQGKQFLQSLVELDYSLHSSMEEFELPDWTKKCFILNEEDEIIKYKKIEDKLVTAQKQLKRQQDQLKQINQYKLLLTSTGIILEEVVSQVLKELGFTLLLTETGRTDIIAKYDETIVVVEVKGLTKSAGEKNSAQLEKWASQYFVEHEIIAKPLLIVNGYKDLSLKKRTEDVFPNQMIKYAESRNHCMITTVQLLCMFLDIVSGPTAKDSIIKDFLNTVGIYKKYLKYEEYIKFSEEDDETAE